MGTEQKDLEVFKVNRSSQFREGVIVAPHRVTKDEFDGTSTELRADDYGSFWST